MAVPQLDLELYQGDDFYDELSFSDDVGPLDFSEVGTTVRAQIRERVWSEPSVEITCVILDTDTITIALTAAEVATCPVRGMWDLEVDFPDLGVRTLVRGSVTVHPQVTRDDVEEGP